MCQLTKDGLKCSDNINKMEDENENEDLDLNMSEAIESALLLAGQMSAHSSDYVKPPSSVSDSSFICPIKHPSAYAESHQDLPMAFMEESSPEEESVESLAYEESVDSLPDAIDPSSEYMPSWSSSEDHPVFYKTPKAPSTCCCPCQKPQPKISFNIPEKIPRKLDCLESLPSISSECNESICDKYFRVDPLAELLGNLEDNILEDLTKYIRCISIILMQEIDRKYECILEEIRKNANMVITVIQCLTEKLEQMNCSPCNSSAKKSRCCHSKKVKKSCSKKKKKCKGVFSFPMVEQFVNFLFDPPEKSNRKCRC